MRTVDKTGVEMEALTAASIAALTVYDMVKAVEKGVTITNVQLIEKLGGKSGTGGAREDGTDPLGGLGRASTTGRSTRCAWSDWASPGGSCRPTA